MALPFKLAVIIPALKFPVTSLFTNELLVLELVAAATVVLIPAIVAVFTPAKVLTVGKSAVPDKSPANCNFPLIVVLASATEALVTNVATNAVVAIWLFCVFGAAVGAVGVPVNVGLINDLLVIVSVPDSVAIVPEVGKVILVKPTLFNVVL